MQTRRLLDTTQSQLLWTASSSASMHRVLMAAAEEFAVKGFHGATTRDIARRAGLSPAAMYQHYESKEEVLNDLILVTHEAILGRMEEAQLHGSDPVQRLRWVVTVLATFHAEIKILTRLASNELHCLSTTHREPIVEMRRRMYLLIKRCLVEGIAVGRFATTDANMATLAIISMAIGVSQWFSPTGPLTAQQVGAYYGSLAIAVASRDSSVSALTAPS